MILVASETALSKGGSWRHLSQGQHKEAKIFFFLAVNYVYGLFFSFLFLRFPETYGFTAREGAKPYSVPCGALAWIVTILVFIFKILVWERKLASIW